MSSARMDSTMAEKVFKLSFRILATLPIGHGPRHFSGLWDAKAAGDLEMRHPILPNRALGSDIRIG